MSQESAPSIPLAPCPSPLDRPASVVPVLTTQIDPDLASNHRYHTYQLHSSFLPDDRAISVYLPEQYLLESDRRFPVFYLHDGQNLFDKTTSYVPGKTWQAHSTADQYTRQGTIEPIILVGIANTGIRRMAEYTPDRDLKLGGGEGPAYSRLLTTELKPFIDRTYRTLPGPTHTALGGSSLGALISLFIAIRHPDVFSRVAVMSPSLWWNRRSILRTIQRAPKPPLKIWLDIGMAEGLRHVRDTENLYRILLGLGWQAEVDLKFTEIPGATHDEGAWAARFGDVLRFLFPASPPAWGLPTDLPKG